MVPPDDLLIMPSWTRHRSATHTQLPATTALAANGHRTAVVKAMATASRIFSVAEDVEALSNVAAGMLAVEPGQLCLVSLACRGGDALRPVALAHERPTESRTLRRVLTPQLRTPADAFSREVFRSGGALRMVISRPRQLRLWLPDAYWAYVERTGVSGVLAAALRDRDRVFGTLLLWRERDQPAFNELDQAYVVSLAARLTLGLATHPMAASMALAALG
jgi:hypothetical protein